jgi:hypothetical protein
MAKLLKKAPEKYFYDKGGDTHEASIPETRPHVIQIVGDALGIEPELQLEEKLTSPPKGKKNKYVSNYK